MCMNYVSLIEFESYRKESNMIPPNGSNSFFTIGDGKINLLTYRTIYGYNFDLFIDENTIHIGSDNFVVDGTPYNKLIVIRDTKLIIDGILTIHKTMEVYGEVELINSQLIINDNGEVIFDHSSILTIDDESCITVQPNSKLVINGKLITSVDVLNTLINIPNIILDNANIIRTTEVVNDDIIKSYSLIDYNGELIKKIINLYSQGDKLTDDFRVSYTWTNGNPLDGSQVIELRVEEGNIVLGDFRLSIDGEPITLREDMHLISDIIVNKNGTLHVSDNYNGFTYNWPELYIGHLIGNSKRAASGIIHGNLIADGSTSTILIDNATLTISDSGKFYLRNGSIIRCLNNATLHIHGDMFIDNIEQLKSFEPQSIVFGDNGKLHILNTDTNKTLFTVPNGILTSDLYRLFHDRLHYIEYHITNGSGIAIDRYFDSYQNDMAWYDNKRLEVAIRERLLVWHNNAYIELDSDIIPWINEHSNLFDIAKLFLDAGPFERNLLQRVVELFTGIDCGNILFRFKNGSEVGEATLTLESVNMKSIFKNPMIGQYELTTDNTGQLFLNDKFEKSNIDLITKSNRIMSIDSTKTSFAFP